MSQSGIRYPLIFNNSNGIKTILNIKIGNLIFKKEIFDMVYEDRIYDSNWLLAQMTFR